MTLTQDCPKIQQFNPDNPPDLRFTKIKKYILEDQEAKYLAFVCSWNRLVKLVHDCAFEKVKTFDELQRITSFNIKLGEFTDNGFNPLNLMADAIDDDEFIISIQNVEANKAWLGSLEMFKKLNKKIEVHFKWANHKKAAYPGEEGILSWSPYDN